MCSLAEALRRVRVLTCFLTNDFARNVYFSTEIKWRRACGLYRELPHPLSPLPPSPYQSKLSPMPNEAVGWTNAEAVIDFTSQSTGCGARCELRTGRNFSFQLHQFRISVGGSRDSLVRPVSGSYVSYHANRFRRRRWDQQQTIHFIGASNFAVGRDAPWTNTDAVSLLKLRAIAH